MDGRPVIAFLTIRDSRSRRAWSGTQFHMSAALARHCGDVRRLLPAAVGLQDLARRLLTAHYPIYSHQAAEAFGAAFSALLQNEDANLVFACSDCASIARLCTDLPIVYTDDSTFAQIEGRYASFTGIPATAASEAHDVQYAAIHTADLLLYPSEWAARSAIERYGANPARVRIVPMGANLELIPLADSITGLIERRSGRHTLELLFVGSDWERKGGDIALATRETLAARGIPAHLTVCGCLPPRRLPPADVTVVPFVDKDLDPRATALGHMLEKAFVVLVPTRAECFGITFCEASAFGVPTVTTCTGGVSAAVREGENGHLLPLEAPPESYASVIAALWNNVAAYAELAWSSRRRFERELNWDRWGVTVQELLRALL